MFLSGLSVIEHSKESSLLEFSLSFTGMVSKKLERILSTMCVGSISRSKNINTMCKQCMVTISY